MSDTYLFLFQLFGHVVLMSSSWKQMCCAVNAKASGVSPLYLIITKKKLCIAYLAEMFISG